MSPYRKTTRMSRYSTFCCFLVKDKGSFLWFHKLVMTEKFLLSAARAEVTHMFTSTPMTENVDLISYCANRKCPRYIMWPCGIITSLWMTAWSKPNWDDLGWSSAPYVLSWRPWLCPAQTRFPSGDDKVHLNTQHFCGVSYEVESNKKK